MFVAKDASPHPSHEFRRNGMLIARSFLCEPHVGHNMLPHRGLRKRGGGCFIFYTHAAPPELKPLFFEPLIFIF